jgi:hypothetical protein
LEKCLFSNEGAKEKEIKEKEFRSSKKYHARFHSEHKLA